MKSSLKTRDGEREMATKQHNPKRWPKYVFFGGLGVAALATAYPYAVQRRFDNETRPLVDEQAEKIINKRMDGCVEEFRKRTTLTDFTPEVRQGAVTVCADMVSKQKISAEELLVGIPEVDHRLENGRKKTLVAACLLIGGFMTALIGMEAWMLQSRAAKRRKDDEDGGNGKPGGPEQEPKKSGLERHLPTFMKAVKWVQEKRREAQLEDLFYHISVTDWRFIEAEIRENPHALLEIARLVSRHGPAELARLNASAFLRFACLSSGVDVSPAAPELSKAINDENPVVANNVRDALGHAYVNGDQERRRAMAAAIPEPELMKLRERYLDFVNGPSLRVASLPSLSH